ncbi:MAG: hypothetical protein ACLTNS_09690 [Acutalibacteraceae bacterium]
MICVPDSVFYFTLQLSFLMGTFFVNSSQAAANFVSLAAAFFVKSRRRTHAAAFLFPRKVTLGLPVRL